jgi:hypothetical protein
MLNPVTFTYEAESGPLTVTASGPDYAAYEDTYDRAAISDLAGGRYKFWCFVLWHAMKRQGMTEETFEAFLEAGPQFTPGKVEDVVPLESTAPTGS